MSSSFGGKRGFLLLAVVAALGAALWFFSRGKQEKPVAPAPVAEPAAATADAPTPPLNRPPPRVDQPEEAIPTAPGELREFAIAKAKETKNQYLEFARFPPNSRPADGSQQHLIDWNREMVDEQAMTYDDQKRRISVRASLDRFFAEAGQELTVTIQVWHGDPKDPQTPIDFDLLGHLEIYDGDNDTTGNPLARSGAGPGYRVVDTFEFKPGKELNRRVGTFTPSKAKELADGLADARATVWVQLGEDRKPYSMSFRYVTEAPLVILGKAAESSASGSLDVDVNADIKVLGPVLVQATLFDATGEVPIAVYDDYYRPTSTGKQLIPLHFFGKIIRESGLNGPYQIKALHGHVKQLDKEPEELWWEYHQPITTRDYTAAEFSGSEWQSPEKDAKIQQYDEYIEDIGSGGR